MRFSLLLVVAVILAIAVSASSGVDEAADTSVLMFIGGYTRDEGWVHGKSKGVYTFAFFPGNGTLKEISVLDVGLNPTFLRGTKAGKKKQFLYAINECAEASRDFPGTTTGYVVALEVGMDGKLKLLNRMETRGPGPAHVSVSPNDDFVAVSLYGGGGVILYPIQADGSLAPPSDSHFYKGGSGAAPSQDAAHLHSTTWVPGGTNVVFAADLGNDQIVQYKFDPSSKKLGTTTLPIIKRPPGSGPRHMALHPSGNVAYVVDEISNTIGVYPLNADSKSLSLSTIQRISTLPSGFTQSSSSADIHVSADGKFVYTSNRGHNSIAIFKVTSQTTGILERIGTEPTRGQTPRSFLVYNDYLIVANQDTDTIEVFRRNADGTLTHTGNSVSSSTPVSLYIPSTV
uniref:6-phosphogluconolactonase n=1 Tax=Globisporangium ultimum (strain ATCC 200006 / CBS 805.95 / DAOM BR144) TaxID=431595 RepID=K3X3U8_GLOUD